MWYLSNTPPKVSSVSRVAILYIELVYNVMFIFVSVWLGLTLYIEMVYNVVLSFSVFGGASGISQPSKYRREMLVWWHVCMSLCVVCVHVLLLLVYLCWECQVWTLSLALPK